MDGVILTPLKKIYNPKGDIFHAMKKSDDGFSGFGEAYFSMIHKDEIKGWKKHKEMVLNLVVPLGAVEFIIYNDKKQDYFNVILSTTNYQRLTIEAGLWMAFRGIEKNSMLLNLASIEHNPNESESIDLKDIKYEW